MSMRDAGIVDGDLLAVQRASEARNGQIVVARLGDEVTVKRFRRTAEAIELLPENPDFEPIVVPLADGATVEIEGMAVGLIRNRPAVVSRAHSRRARARRRGGALRQAARPPAARRARGRRRRVRRRVRDAGAAAQHRPGAGAELRTLGIRHPRDLASRDGHALYRALCSASGRRQDPCVLDTFLAATDFMRGAPAGAVVDLHRAAQAGVRRGLRAGQGRRGGAWQAARAPCRSPFDRAARGGAPAAPRSGSSARPSPPRGRTSDARRGVPAPPAAGGACRARHDAPRSPAMTGLDTAERDKLDDEKFAFPEQRKLPIEDAAHVRNAVARFDQVEDVSDAERDAAWKRLLAAAKRHGVEVSEQSWRELGKPREGG